MLALAVAAWAKLGWIPAPHPIDGRSPDNPGPVEVASRIMVLAFGLSALAAIFTVVGWIGL